MAVICAWNQELKGGGSHWLSSGRARRAGCAALCPICHKDDAHRRGNVLRGTRYHEGTRGLLHHRKVSAVEPAPGVSGLRSTLTQATFSWLLHRERGWGGDGEEMSVWTNSWRRKGWRAAARCEIVSGRKVMVLNSQCLRTWFKHLSRGLLKYAALNRALC